MIDTHCHLDVAAFDATAVVARATATGVLGIVLPAIRPRTWGRVREVAGTPRPECATRSVSTRRSFRSSIPVSSPAISQPGWSTGPGSDRSGDSGRL
ncbi:MAG TPA: hypothetical protein VHN14_05100 [Kofleriaceae bacterium]|nr:hypothetical protein [Kofleriaceae bacterium]